MPSEKRTNKDLVAENQELRLRLEEAEETLRAIREGEVDALVVNAPQGSRIFTLEGAEYPYRVLVESMNEGAATLAPDGTIRYCNLRLASMLEIPLENLIGGSLVQYVAPLYAENFVKNLESCNEDEFRADIMLMTNGGNSFPAHFSCSPLGDGSNGMTAVITDLSERKRKDDIIASRTAELECTLNELHEKELMLLQQSRMAAMGEMISNIAHQWRQPLNSLGLMIQTLPILYETGHFTEKALSDTVKNAMRLVHHMSGTIDDFRNFFKTDKEKVEFKLSDVIANALKLLEGTLSSRQITVAVDNKDDPTMYGYPGELSQVVLNILTNAKDAFEERQTNAPRVLIKSWAMNNTSVLTISDNAGGIPEDILFKVFDPYFTTKGMQGTGIGLFMAKNIIEKNMNGKMSVRNTSEGAEFRIEIRL